MGWYICITIRYKKLLKCSNPEFIYFVELLKAFDYGTIRGKIVKHKELPLQLIQIITQELEQMGKSVSTCRK